MAPDENRPLIYIDGVRVDGAYTENLDPNRIERIEVIKGGAAVKIYGEKAANGVIQIFLKEQETVSAGLWRSVVEGKTTEVLQRLFGESKRDISDEPVFTPMTVRPEITNVNAVIQAMEQEYPQMLRDAGIGGRVVVWFFITETGEVADARISRTSGNSALDDAALSVADVFDFTPALNGDKPVAVWVQFPITFEVH